MHNYHTNMTNLAKLRVHIAPVGFEIDRIVLPAIQMKADKVWLIREANPSKEKARVYIEKIVSEFKKEKIKVEDRKSTRLNSSHT